MKIRELAICTACAAALVLSVHQENEIVKRDRTIKKLEVKVQSIQEDLDTANLTLSYYDYYVNTAPIYDIALSPELQQYTFDTCKQYGIVDKYQHVLAVMWQESNYTADIISSTNDYGLMQINEINHERLRGWLGVTDFLDPQQNIECGVYMLSELYKEYIDDHMVLMAYNIGRSGAAAQWQDGNYATSYSHSVLSKVKYLKNI